jgi:hypothetical protein
VTVAEEREKKTVNSGHFRDSAWKLLGPIIDRELLHRACHRVVTKNYRAKNNNLYNSSVEKKELACSKHLLKNVLQFLNFSMLSNV